MNDGFGHVWTKFAESLKAEIYTYIYIDKEHTATIDPVGNSPIILPTSQICCPIARFFFD